MASDYQRAVWRRSKQALRIRAQVAASLARGRCAVRRNGKGGPCDTALEVRVEHLGPGVARRHLVCPCCERRRAGRCQRCERPVAGRKGFALYCADPECLRIVRKAWRLKLDPRKL